MLHRESFPPFAQRRPFVVDLYLVWPAFPLNFSALAACFVEFSSSKKQRKVSTVVQFEPARQPLIVGAAAIFDLLEARK